MNLKDYVSLPLAYERGKLPWHEFVLSAPKPEMPKKELLLPLSPDTFFGMQDLRRWRHDFPPPQSAWFDVDAPERAPWSVYARETEQLLCEFLDHYYLEGRQLGPWQHATALPVLSDLFHVRYPMAAPKPLDVVRPFPFVRSDPFLQPAVRSRHKKKYVYEEILNEITESVATTDMGVPEEVPYSPGVLVRRLRDYFKFKRHAEKLARLRDGYKPKNTQKTLKEYNKELRTYGIHSAELPMTRFIKPLSVLHSFPAAVWTPQELDLTEIAGAQSIETRKSRNNFLKKFFNKIEVYRKYYHSPESALSSPQRFSRDAYLIDRMQLDTLTAAEKRELNRRIEFMESYIRGECPTGTCPQNRCAAPGLSPAEQQATHAANLLPKIETKLSVGSFYAVVVVSGQPRIKPLKAVSEAKAGAEFDRLVESEVKKARRTSEDAAEAEKRVRENYRYASLYHVDSVIDRRSEA